MELRTIYVPGGRVSCRPSGRPASSRNEPLADLRMSYSGRSTCSTFSGCVKTGGAGGAGGGGARN